PAVAVAVHRGRGPLRRRGPGPRPPTARRAPTRRPPAPARPSRPRAAATAARRRTCAANHRAATTGPSQHHAAVGPARAPVSGRAPGERADHGQGEDLVPGPSDERSTAMAYTIGYLIGSLSRESINRQLAEALVRLGPDDFEFREIQIGNLPLYNRDYDVDYPPEGRALKEAIRGSDGLLFVSPEYNRSIPGVL